MSQAPDVTLAREVAASILGDSIDIERVSEGVSTYVYRILHGEQILYLRVLPEEASFAVEAHIHRLLRGLGIHAPEVVYCDDRNPFVQRSVMITEALPGHSLKSESNPGIIRNVLRAAGREVALINTVAVHGYGWIDRSETTTLRGERATFSDFYGADLAYGLSRLSAFGFAAAEIASIRSALDALLARIQTSDARLVHGDLDTSHIFHTHGVYSGLIDFGEIMGNHPLYDLALFHFYDDLPPENGAFNALLEGYGEITPLAQDDLDTIERVTLLFGIWKIVQQDRRAVRRDIFIKELIQRVRRHLESVQGTRATSRS